VIRTQIQLTEEQSEALKQISSKEGRSVAELVRSGVDQVIRSYGVVSSEELRRRALSVVGKFNIKDENLAVDHDLYASEAYES
jgi:hypothetical protein